VAITNPYALYVPGGNYWIDGQIQGANGTPSVAEYACICDTTLDYSVQVW